MKKSPPTGRLIEFSTFERTSQNSRVYDIANVRQGGHGHAHGIGLVSVLGYSAAVNDRDSLAFVKSAYEWVKENGSSQVGFFPEVFVPKYDRCETDPIADMIAMALKLTIAGAGDYWTMPIGGQGITFQRAY